MPHHHPLAKPSLLGLTLLALAAGCQPTPTPEATPSPQSQLKPVSLTTNNPAITVAQAAPKLALANHLKRVKAKFYGAYWCPYCERQKQMFGEQAMKKITYIECDPGGPNPQPKLCRQKNIKGYPTWEINGKMYSGMQSLEALAEISGYKGSRNFGN